MKPLEASARHEAELDGIVADAAACSDRELVARMLHLAAESTGAELAVFFRVVGDRVQCLGSRPPHLGSPLAADQSAEWFPWDLRSVRARNYVLATDAGRLRATPTTHLADLGVVSALHLPLSAPRREGALHLYWQRPQPDWDDRWGAQLRALGGFVLLRVA